LGRKHLRKKLNQSEHPTIFCPLQDEPDESSEKKTRRKSVFEEECVENMVCVIRYPDMLFLSFSPSLTQPLVCFL
jgi:hypothetical protein